MKSTTNFLLLFLLGTITLSAQRELLQSGPMLGYSEMREVMLWVQTTGPANVQFGYWPEEHPDLIAYTKTYSTVQDEAFTARLVADQVEPGMRYDYQLLINGKPVQLDYPTTFQTQALWQWRTDPPGFTFALGSCNYVNEPEYDRPGTPYGADHQIFEAIHQMAPDMMLWMGDNVYLREVDWYSQSGIFKRYTHTRSLPEMQPLLASTHHYAIWDDHDYGPDNSDRSFLQKEETLKAFKLFWGNPTYGLPGEGGITTHFQWADVEFFMLDNRYFRSPDKRKTGEPTQLGEAQIQWLIDALASSYASFKFVVIGGQVLSTAAYAETYINTAPEERIRLLKLIEEEGFKNVIFLTGDVHHSELSKLTLNNGNELYDFSVSPYTAGPDTRTLVRNGLVVEGTVVQERNFATIEVTGPRTQRMLTLRVFNSSGEELWMRTIDQQK
ncbi:MAG: alkaline phosphatase family protein [Saprospirales bacterium]|nr:alkaline phosphatase family protein [Saprospirales bacterium]